jgi:hypothetical protein
MEMATLRANAAPDSLRVGERRPELKWQTLTGRTAVLPQASAGTLTLVAMGFALLTSPAGSHPVAAGPDHADHRSEP